jgi:hypothetical protein
LFVVAVAVVVVVAVAAVAVAAAAGVSSRGSPPGRESIIVLRPRWLAEELSQFLLSLVRTLILIFSFFTI